jgi:hypothetical protein
MSSDQKSGLPNPRPIGNASKTGMMASHISAQSVSFSSRPVKARTGPKISAMVTSTATGSTKPVRRHSIQNNAASADLSGVTRRGMARETLSING